ncbi:CU044_5270 family protein [Nonomuraea sp. NPDC049646]|uniref:CU044_5270 family protein n=1 Tax=unclassified Nonomuraea TaxID=2593643 RepID=UPI0037B8BF4D
MNDIDDLVQAIDPAPYALPLGPGARELRDAIMADEPRRARRLPHLRLRILLAPAATAAVVALVVTLVVTLVTSLTAAPPVLTPSRPNQELYDLADRIERLPASSGAYWRDVRIEGNAWSAGGRYMIMVVERRETWQPRDPADVVIRRWSSAAAHPATVADERAWRASGAPAQVAGPCYVGGRTSCRPVPLSDGDVVGGPPSARGGGVGGSKGCGYSSGLEPRGIYPDMTVAEFTMADLSGFPARPDALLKRLHAYHELSTARGFAQSFEEFLPVTVNLLAMPLGPAQRAAVIRVLAGSPSTKVVGTVRDPLGRAGLSVDFGGTGSQLLSPDRTATVRDRHILDPGTGELLASVSYAARTGAGVSEGQVLGYRARGPESGWTGPPARAPEGCKRGG